SCIIGLSTLSNQIYRMSTKTKIKPDTVQKVRDLYHLLDSNRRLFTIKEVVERAGIDSYPSVINALALCVKTNNPKAISNKRVDQLQAAALELREEKLQPANS